MKTLGLNQLWLPVFTDGKAQISGTPFSVASAPDLLAEAHRATQGTDIAVYAVLDLLKWGPDALVDAQDLTLRGDNSAQAALRQDQGNQDDQDGVASHGPVPLDPAEKRLAVSPFAQGVKDSLRSLVSTVGTHPGIAGIVWRETAPSGYAVSQQGGDDAFGYSLDGRLAFLRRAHTDPIDIGEAGGEDSSLPNWDDGAQDAADAWGRFRVEADERLLQILLTAWPAAGLNGGRRPVLVQQRRDSWEGDWFGSWNGPPAPLPAYHSPWEQQTADSPVYPEAPGQQAKSQSKVALLRVDSQETPSPASLASYLDAHLKDRVKAPWDGFVLEFRNEEGSGLPALQSLASGLSPKSADAAVKSAAEIR